MSLRLVDVNFRVCCDYKQGGKYSEVAKVIRDIYNDISQIKIIKPVGKCVENICIIETAKSIPVIKINSKNL